MTQYPRVFRVRQQFPRPRVADVPAAVDAALAGLQLAQRVCPGQRVAISAGSRGIANMADILRAAVAHLRRLGADPFIVPAMGSHGGGTAAGQLQILESYGITPDYCGCPIHSSLERHRLPRGGRVPGPLRSPCGRGRPCAGVRPDQAAHAVHRGH